MLRGVPCGKKNFRTRVRGSSLPTFPEPGHKKQRIGPGAIIMPLELKGRVCVYNEPGAKEDTANGLDTAYAGHSMRPPCFYRRP